MLKSIVDEHPVSVSPFSDRGTVLITLWSYLLFLPNIWKAVQSAICSCDIVTASQVQILHDRVIDLATKVSDWRSRYEPLVNSIPDHTFEAKEEKPFETLGMCLVCLLILKRLTIALEPLGPSALGTEMEVEGIAEDLLVLERKAIVNNARAGLFMAFKRVAAQATLATTNDWRISSVVDDRVGPNGLISRSVFERWCRLKGRRV